MNSALAKQSRCMSHGNRIDSNPLVLVANLYKTSTGGMGREGKGREGGGRREVGSQEACELPSVRVRVVNEAIAERRLRALWRGRQRRRGAPLSYSARAEQRR